MSKSADIRPEQADSQRCYILALAENLIFGSRTEERSMEQKSNNDIKTRYDDIIDLPHPTSRKHPRMSMHDRAAQFSPFAALVGYGDAIKETEKTAIDEYGDV